MKLTGTCYADQLQFTRTWLNVDSGPCLKQTITTIIFYISCTALEVKVRSRRRLGSSVCMETSIEVSADSCLADPTIHARYNSAQDLCV